MCAHTHRQVHAEAEQQNRNMTDAPRRHVCKFSRLQPNTHHFPRSPSVSSEDKEWPYCPQLISSGRERDKHMCTHIHTQPCFLTDMLWALWQFNGILQWAKQCNLHADIYEHSMEELMHIWHIGIPQFVICYKIINYIGNIIPPLAIHGGTISELQYAFFFYCLSVALQSFQPATRD